MNLIWTGPNPSVSGEKSVSGGLSFCTERTSPHLTSNTNMAAGARFYRQAYRRILFNVGSWVSCTLHMSIYGALGYLEMGRILFRTAHASSTSDPGNLPLRHMAPAFNILNNNKHKEHVVSYLFCFAWSNWYLIYLPIRLTSLPTAFALTHYTSCSFPL
jgi:hypothetical protein